MFHRKDFEGKESRRVYARLDRRATEKERTTFWFDCVDAAWLDDWRGEPGFQTWRLAPVTVSAVTAPRDHPCGRYLRRSDWMELSFEDRSAGDIEVVQYTNMFERTDALSLARVRPLAAPLIQRLRSTFSWDAAPRATREQLEDAIDWPGRRAEWLAAFDVGQGACNGLISDCGVPVAYFDFGGGVLGQENTFPTRLGKACFTADPLMILSHWDWDHWSSVARFPEALERTWIVPDQHIDRPVHLQFAADVHAKGQLLIWPRNLPSLPFGAGHLELCTGTTRNDTGLALFFTARNGERAIVSGDARYGAVPSVRGFGPDAVVAPHHGAKCAKTKIPRPASPSVRRAVYSFGDGNTYGHATAQCRSAHAAAGWSRSVDTAHCAVGQRGGVVVVGKPTGYVHHFPCRGSACDWDVSKS